MFKAVLLLLLSVTSASVFAHGMSAEDQARFLSTGYWGYMQLGAKHMLTGYDHLLFLLGVIFFLTRFKDILKFITAFTLGHSITLIFATLFELTANYYLIDAVIALTVCYKAFENLDGFNKYFQVSTPNLTWMVFAFGLIHGFGLSTRLQQLPLAGEALVMKIISFNIGVELGQIIALSLMLILLAGWRKMASFRRFSTMCNVALIMTGGLLLIMQLHAYQHSQYPDEFPLNADDHHHIHENMTPQTLPMLTDPTHELEHIHSHPHESIQTKNAEIHSHNDEHLHSHIEDKAPEKILKEIDQHSHDGVHFHSHEHATETLKPVKQHSHNGVHPHTHTHNDIPTKTPRPIKKHSHDGEHFHTH